MIFGVVYVHAAAHDQIGGMGTGFFDYFMGFFNYAALRVPVPLLAIVSGYLLFIADLDLRPVALWKKKFRTIAFPFFVFNFLAIALFFGLQHLIPDAIMRIDLLHASRYDWINALFGVRDAPFDYPMYFMRDLLVLIALAPVFGLFIRRAPMIGLAIVAVVFYFNYDGYLVIRSTSAIMFYIGGVLAVKKYDLLAFDHFAAPMLALLVAICAGVVVLHVDNINYAALTGPFLVWPAFKYLKNTVVGRLAARSAKYSFFIFIAHAPLLQLLRLGYTRHLQDIVPYSVFWVVAPAMVIVTLVAIYNAAMKAAPMVFSAAIGGRTDMAMPAKVDRRGTPRPASALVYSDDFRMALSKS